MMKIVQNNFFNFLLKQTADLFAFLHKVNRCALLIAQIAWELVCLHLLYANLILHVVFSYGFLLLASSVLIQEDKALRR